ncbi:MAG: fumarylacetoacetate hydrolase family protein [Rhodomicrobium sp.]
MTITVPLDSRLRLLSYADESGRARLGFVRADGHAVDVAHGARQAGVAIGFDGSSMLALIEAGPRGLAEVREIAGADVATSLKLGELRILPPLPKLKRNIFCVGWNYLEHFAEGAKMRDAAQKLPEHPVFFTKATGALNGPFDPIPYDPAISREIDWEVELALVIGKRGRNISEAEAPDHVFGYTVLNDVSARDLQKTAHGGQWFKGKSLDGHAPMGPWIVPAADLDPTNLRLVLRVDGAVKQDGSSSDMYFKIPRIVAELSRGLTLEPGDVIATGTPPGVGMGRNPPEWLKPGDAMETEIAEIGAMRNIVHAV